MPIWPPVMAGKNDDNKLHQDNLSCKWTGHLGSHLGGHIPIFHVCFGGCLAGHLGGCLRECIHIYMSICRINKVNNALQTFMSWFYFRFGGGPGIAELV